MPNSPVDPDDSVSNADVVYADVLAGMEQEKSGLSFNEKKEHLLPKHIKASFAFLGFTWKPGLWNKSDSEIDLKWTFVITSLLLILYMPDFLTGFESGFYTEEQILSSVLTVLALPVILIEFTIAKTPENNYPPLWAFWIILFPVGALVLWFYSVSNGGPWREQWNSQVRRESSTTGAYTEIPDSLRSVPIFNAYQEIMRKEFDNTVHKGDEFELFCAFLLEKEGYIIEKVEGGSGDMGTDIRVKSPGFIGAQVSVQCKHYIDRTVGSDVIQKSMGALNLKQESFDQVVVMTSGTFTKPAIEMATDNNVTLIDNAVLRAWSEKHLVGISLTDILRRAQIWVG